MSNLVEVKLLKSFQISEIKVKEIALEWMMKRGVEDSILEVEVVGEKKIRSLNSKFRGKDYPTDVLSFPMPTSNEPQRLLGNIFLYSDIIMKNARESGKNFEEEFEFILRHGIDHLVGIHHKE